MPWQWKCEMTNEDTVTRLSQGEINNIQKITPNPGGEAM